MRTTVIALMLALLLPTSALAASTTELYQQSFNLESAGSYAEALSRMDQLAAAGEDGYLLHLRRGWLLYLNGRYADAVEAYGVAVQRSPGSVEARLGQTLPLMALKRWTEAEQACRAVLNLAPGNYLAMSRLAYVLFSQGKFEPAEQAYRDVLAQYPSDNDMRSGLGWSLLRQGRNDAAKAAFDEVLETVPGHVSAGQGMSAME